MSINVLARCALVALAVTAHLATATWIVGDAGDNCVDACMKQGMNCNLTMHTGNTSKFFSGIQGANCTSFDHSPWNGHGGPFISFSGVCAGFIDVPAGVACQMPSGDDRSRVCNCDAPNTARHDGVIGTAWSQGFVDPTERAIFAEVLGDGDQRRYGTMTHFWLTPNEGEVTVRYYVDGETEASIQFTPSLASGVGFDDHHNPWGNEYFGKGALTGAWFWNFKVPFYKSIRVTIQCNSMHSLYVILRGGLSIPVRIGTFNLQKKARDVGQKLYLKQYRTDAVYKALDFVTLANVSKGKAGAFFMHTLSFNAPNLNTLEGCYHWHSPPETPFPATLLSSGTEDFFDSAYYFNGGKFHLPVSGFTHLNITSDGSYGPTTFSAYRFHMEDPLIFTDGLKFVWRNGDMSDASGIKCNIEKGGTPNGHPGTAYVKAYAWVYEYDNPV